MVKQWFYCHIKVYNNVKEKVRTEGGKLNYICDKCLQGYWCYCNLYGLCPNRCKDCGEPCTRRCKCPDINQKFYNNDGVPYHWIKYVAAIGFQPYYVRCNIYDTMRKIATAVSNGEIKPENARYKTGWSTGPNGDEEYYMDYSTIRNFTVSVAMN